MCLMLSNDFVNPIITNLFGQLINQNTLLNKPKIVKKRVSSTTVPVRIVRPPVFR